MGNRIQDAIGNTPLVELTNLDAPSGVRIFAKLEYLNPGGSIKDRMVEFILNQAELNGELSAGATIIENTSGNTGAAISMLASARGYRVVLTMPDKVSREKQDTLTAWVQS
ncbi:pyridoxal-phosphate dependent enzyme [Halomonas sp. Mc5H-6]|nr:pyridoxal-phosphate dependent enzyme [Halomonas sp. Mc5H-6]MCO7247520.1 pyridoxal-phosphate dependent enzyme [Halomonas sp. Mc5H-6]